VPKLSLDCPVRPPLMVGAMTPPLAVGEGALVPGADILPLTLGELTAAEGGTAIDMGLCWAPGVVRGTGEAAVRCCCGGVEAV